MQGVLRAIARASIACALVATPACATKLPPVPANLTTSPAALPVAPVTANNAPPRIVAMYFSTLDVRRGAHWSARFVTGTNVASVEVRTNLFSIDVPRTAYGRFGFTLDVLDTPPIFVRDYRLRVIARNSAGAQDEEDVPLRIR